MLQRISNVVDGEVALAECNDPIPNRILMRLRLGTAPAILKEVPVHASTKVRAQHPECAVLVAEPPCRFRARGPVKKESAECFVLPLSRMCKLFEEALGRRQPIW